MKLTCYSTVALEILSPRLRSGLNSRDLWRSSVGGPLVSLIWYPRINRQTVDNRLIRSLFRDKLYRCHIIWLIWHHYSESVWPKSVRLIHSVRYSVCFGRVWEPPLATTSLVEKSLNPSSPVKWFPEAVSPNLESKFLNQYKKVQMVLSTLANWATRIRNQIQCTRSTASLAAGTSLNQNFW